MIIDSSDNQVFMRNLAGENVRPHVYGFGNGVAMDERQLLSGRSSSWAWRVTENVRPRVYGFGNGVAIDDYRFMRRSVWFKFLSVFE